MNAVLKKQFRLKRPTKRNTKYPVQRLPFVQTAPDYNAFAFPEVDGYGAGCELGQAAAEAYMAMLRRMPDNGGNLQHFVLSALQHCNPSDFEYHGSSLGSLGKRGIVVGFFSYLDHWLKHAALLLGGGIAGLTDAEISAKLQAAANRTESEVDARLRRESGVSDEC